MFTANDLWLRGQAAQANVLHLANYNNAFFGTAMVQAAQMSASAPAAFWAAMGRAGASKPARVEKTATKRAVEAPVADVPALTPTPSNLTADVATVVAEVAPKPNATRAKSIAVLPDAKDASARGKAKTEVKAAPTAVATPDLAERPVVSEPVAAKSAAARPEPALTPNIAPIPQLLDAPRDGKGDDLTILAGIGAKLAGALNEIGIYHFDQIAALNDGGILWLDSQQKGFRMIAARYDLVGQAKAIS